MASKFGGYMGQVLKIDLTTRETSEFPWTDEEREMYLGGKIMAAKILYDSLEPGTDPVSPDNVMVVSTGPLTGTGAPSSSRFNVSALSPLTGIVASSNCGGTFGMNLKRTGYDALVIVGKSEEPVWLEMTDDGVEFHDASDLWGKNTLETEEALGDRKGKLVIGPAGENLVKYAAILSGDRAAGRAGMGAVMGSKNLKAITATGTHKTPVHKRDKAKKLYKSWVKMLQNHPLTGKELPKYGTAFLLRRMQRTHTLATRNYGRGQFDDYDMLSGETLAEKHLIKNTGCVTCPIKCSRQVEVDGRKVKGPELETIALLGANLENNSLEKIMRWNVQLDELGMDTISVAGTIGFAMELQEKGLWDSGLHFGETDNLSAVFDDIAHRRGIGDLLADGTRALSEKFGGKDFSINVKGLELAAYEPRGAVGLGLGYAVASRGGCHLNSGYVILMEGLALGMNPYTPRSKAALNILNQNLMESISAAGNCLFPVFTFLPGWLINHPDNIITKIVNASMAYQGGAVNLLNRVPAWLLPIHLPTLPHSKALRHVTGMKMTLGKFRDIGERGYNLERIMNNRFGITEKDDTLPKRLTDEPQIEGNPNSRVPLDAMKGEYYKVRGWDKNGIPTEKKRRSLGIA